MFQETGKSLAQKMIQMKQVWLSLNIDATTWVEKDS